MFFMIALLTLALTSIVKCQIPFLDIFTYQGLSSSSSCTRVANSISGIGCSAGQGGTKGTLFNVSSSANLDSFLSFSSSSSSPPTQAFVVVLSSSLLSEANVDKLSASGKLAGLVVRPDTIRASQYSQDSRVPSIGLQGSNTSSSYAWNPNGVSLLQNLYRFPIFEISSLNASTISTLLAAIQFNSNNGYTSYPLYAMEIQSNMYSGSSSASTCLKRGFCSPIGDLSVWSTFTLNMSSTDSKPIIVVATHFDANALVHDLAFGASSRASTAVLLTIADALSKSSMSSLPNTLLFTLFDAESWGSAGSKRFVQDISTPFQCISTSSSYCPFSSPACGNPCMQDLDFQKINFNSIASIVEVDVGGLLYTSPPTTNSSLPLYMHVDQVNSQVSSLLTSFTNASDSNVTFTPAFTSSTNNRLPPSSAMSFLAQKNIPTIFISDYQTQFSNPYYNSNLDDGQGWSDAQIASLCKVASSTAKTLYALAAGTQSPTSNNITANCTTLLNYLDCMTRNLSCSLMQQFLPNQSIPIQPPTSYPGVFSFSSRLSISYNIPFFLHRVLTSKTGTRTGTSCRTDADCGQQSAICIQSQCITSLTRFHDAYGTGLAMDYNTGTFRVRDPNARDTWVESTWDYTRLRIFLQPGLGSQGLEFGVSVLVNLVVFLVLYYWEKVSSII